MPRLPLIRYTSFVETTARTEVAYDGEALRDGTMDVRELAPALLAIGSLCDRANYLLNGERATVSVRVRVSDKGSFKFLVELWQSIPEPVRELLAVQKISDANDILTFLGFLGGGTASALGVLKWLKGRKPAKEEPLPTGFTRIEVNNINIEVRNQVVILAKDPVIKEEWGSTLKPLERPGIDTFEIRSGNERLEVVKESEATYFHPQQESVAAVEQPPIHDGVAETPLVIIKPSFREDLKWEFARDSVAGKFSAEMKDQEFLERVKRREETFGVGDVLIADLHTKTYFTPQGTVRTDYEVLKVKGKVEPPIQSKLF